MQYMYCEIAHTHTHTHCLDTFQWEHEKVFFLLKLDSKQTNKPSTIYEFLKQQQQKSFQLYKAKIYCEM